MAVIRKQRIRAGHERQVIKQTEQLLNGQGHIPGIRLPGDHRPTRYTKFTRQLRLRQMQVMPVFLQLFTRHDSTPALLEMSRIRSRKPL